MLLATSHPTSGVKTPESPEHFGAAEAVPSQEPFMKWLPIESREIAVRHFFLSYVSEGSGAVAAPKDCSAR